MKFTRMHKSATYLMKLVKYLHFKSVIGSRIDATARIGPGSEILNSSFGRYSYCGGFCRIFACDIGSFCSIGEHVTLGGAEHPIEWGSTSPAFYRSRDRLNQKFSEHPRPEPKRIVIGHDVWIGERAMVKQGVEIGTGAVIGMGSVVTRDVAPYAIVAGAPAREIRKRFDDVTIEKLLRSEWWTLDAVALKQRAADISEPEVFLQNIARQTGNAGRAGQIREVT